MHFFLKERYIPKYETSSSYTSTVFRVWEQIFGRSFGIRLEGTSDSKGNVYCYTWENYLAVWESIVCDYFRNFTLPKFSLVYLSQLQLAGLERNSISPFRFAIAWDAASTHYDNGDTTDTTNSFNQTCTGANGALFAGWGAITGGAFSSLTGTYNGVSMTNIQSVTTPGEGSTEYVFGILNPTTGSALAVAIAHASHTGIVTGQSSSYSGVGAGGSGDGISDNHTSNTGSGATSFSTSITPVVSNCWVLWWARNDQSNFVMSTNSTLRGTATGAVAMADSNGATTTGGVSFTMAATWASSANWANIMVSFAPFTAGAGTARGFLLNLLGVGQ